jgi:hypothetical protein
LIASAIKGILDSSISILSVVFSTIGIHGKEHAEIEKLLKEIIIWERIERLSPTPNSPPALLVLKCDDICMYRLPVWKYGE